MEQVLLQKWKFLNSYYQCGDDVKSVKKVGLYAKFVENPLQFPNSTVGGHDNLRSGIPRER